LAGIKFHKRISIERIRIPNIVIKGVSYPKLDAVVWLRSQPTYSGNLIL
jgi:hypothetical protein